MEFMSEGFGLSFSFPVYALIHLVPFTRYSELERRQDLLLPGLPFGGCRYVVGWI